MNPEVKRVVVDPEDDILVGSSLEGGTVIRISSLESNGSDPVATVCKSRAYHFCRACSGYSSCEAKQEKP